MFRNYPRNRPDVVVGEENSEVRTDGNVEIDVVEVTVGVVHFLRLRIHVDEFRWLGIVLDK